MYKELSPLEALERLRQNWIDDSHLFDDELLDIIEKSLKALEIIKEKEPSIMRLRLTESSEHFNKIISARKKLTRKEYELLKEVLL